MPNAIGNSDSPIRCVILAIIICEVGRYSSRGNTKNIYFNCNASHPTFSIRNEKFRNRMMTIISDLNNTKKIRARQRKGTKELNHTLFGELQPRIS